MDISLENHKNLLMSVPLNLSLSIHNWVYVKPTPEFL